jgi:hypothetical protein
MMKLLLFHCPNVNFLIKRQLIQDMGMTYALLPIPTIILERIFQIHVQTHYIHILGEFRIHSLLIYHLVMNLQIHLEDAQFRLFPPAPIILSLIRATQTQVKMDSVLGL